MSDPTPSLMRSMRGNIVCGVLLLCPVVYSFSFTSFLYPKEIVVACGLLLLAILGLFRPIPVAPALLRYWPLWAGLVVTLLLHSVTGTTRVPVLMWKNAALFTMLLLFAALVFPLWQEALWRRRVGIAISISGIAVAVLSLAQYAGIADRFFPVFAHYDQRMYSVFGNQDYLGGYLAMVLPLIVLALLRSRLQHPLAWLGLIPVLLALLLSGSRSAWLAAVVGVLVLRPWRTNKRTLSMLAAGCMAVIGVGVALNFRATIGRILATFGPDDVGGNARLWFWDGTLRMIADAPIIGFGLGNYAYWSPRYMGEALAAPGGEDHLHNTVHTIHAHSEPLEFLAETGLVGAMFGLIWLVSLLRLRGPARGGLAALGVFSCFNATLHSTPHLMVGLILSGMLLRTPVSQTIFKPRFTPLVIAAVLTTFLAWSCWLPDLRLRRAEVVHLAGGNPLPLYEHALGGRPPENRWHSGELLVAYGLALSEAEYPETGRVLDAAQARIDTGELYLLLGEHALFMDDTESAKVYLRECLFRWPGSKRAFRQLYAMADTRERAELEAHAIQWNIDLEIPAT